MNLRILNIAFLGLFLFVSCREEEPLLEYTVKLSKEQSENLLLVANNFQDRYKANGLVGPMGVLYRFTGGETRGGGGGRIEQSPFLHIRGFLFGDIENGNRFANNSIEIGELPDCVTESFSQQSNGNYRYELNFGSGCDVFGQFMKGKLVETGVLSSEDEFTANTSYFDFGSTDMMMSGYDSYTGSWELTVDENDEITWSMTFDCASSLNITDSGNDDRISFRSRSEQNIQESGFLIESRETQISSSSGKLISYQVQDPLFFKFSCNETDSSSVFTFVSGKENGNITSTGSHPVEFKINYGDGNCDNLIDIASVDEAFSLDMGEN